MMDHLTGMAVAKLACGQWELRREDAGSSENNRGCGFNNFQIELAFGGSAGRTADPPARQPISG